MPISYNTQSPDSLQTLLRKVEAIIIVNKESLEFIDSRKGEKVVLKHDYSLELQQPSAKKRKISNSRQHHDDNDHYHAAHSETSHNFHTNPIRNCNSTALMSLSTSFTTNSPTNNNSSILDCDDHEFLKLVDNKTTKAVDELIENWKYRGEAMISEKIAFGAFIDLTLREYSDLVRLHHDFSILYEKYSRVLADDEPESMDAVCCLLHNLERLQVAIGEIHMQTLDVKDPLEQNESVAQRLKSLSRDLKMLTRDVPTVNINFYSKDEDDEEQKDSQIIEFNDCSNISCKQTLTDNDSRVLSMRHYIVDGKQHLACARYDGTVTIWDLTNKYAIATLTGHEGSVFALALYQEKGCQMLATGSRDKTIKLWNLASNTLIFTLSGHTQYVGSLATYKNHGKEILISGSVDKTIKLWDLHDHHIIATLEGHTGAVTALSLFRLNGIPHLASSSRDRSIRIWNLRDKRQISTLVGHDKSIWSLATTIYNDKITLASGGGDGLIKLWNLENNSCIGTLGAYSGEVIALEVIRSHGKVRLVSGSSHDGTIKIWNLNNYCVTKTLHHERIASLITFDNEGKGCMLSGNLLGKIKIWME